MPLITKSTIRAGASGRIARKKQYQSGRTILEDFQKEASYSNEFDIFLSHSYTDASSINNDDWVYLIDYLEKHGFKVYVDWIVDRQLDRDKVNESTARKLRQRMDQSKSLLFVTSKYSSNSKWMPWELGYKDGENGKAAILPVVDTTLQNYYGQEYLGIYPYVEVTILGNLAVWDKSKKQYTDLRDWIDQ